MVHMPLAVSVLIPLIWIVVFYMIRAWQITTKVRRLGWVFIVLQNLSNWLAYVTGGASAHFSSVPVDNIEVHRNAAFVFVMCGILQLLFATWYTFRPPHRERLLFIGLLLLSLINVLLAVRVGHWGGELVFGS